MADYQVLDASLWLSKTRESAYNTPETDGADYSPIVSAEVLPGVLPGVNKRSDAGRVGTGTEFATHLCNGYFDRPQIALSTDIELFDAFARLWLRAFGGAITDSVVEAAVAWKHECELMHKSEGRQLPSFNLIYALGPMSYLLSGMVAARASLTKQGGDPATLAFGLVGSGKFAKPHGVTSLPAYSSPSVCSGGEEDIVVKYTVDAVEEDLSASGCRFKTLSFELDNNVRLDDRCPGDSTLTIGSGGDAYSGKYARRALRTAPRRVVPQFAFVNDDNLKEWLAYVRNKTLTNLTIAVKGPLIGASATNRYEIGVVIPKAAIATVEATNVDGDSCSLATFEALYDSGIDNAAKCYVINGTETGFL